MARRKSSRTKRTASSVLTTRANAPKRVTRSANKTLNSYVSGDWLEQLKLNESYLSLLLGAVVVIVLTIIFFVFIRENNFKTTSSFPKTENTPSLNQIQTKTYILQPGEGLWDVAVKFYGDGFKWTEIARANNLTEEQANALGPGARLIIPNIR